MVLGIHLLVTLARLLRPGGVRAVVAESLILKHQLVIVGRSRRRAPNLTSFDRAVLGIAALFVSVRRIPQLAVILKPSTLFRLILVMTALPHTRVELLWPGITSSQWSRAPNDCVNTLVGAACIIHSCASATRKRSRVGAEPRLI